MKRFTLGEYSFYVMLEDDKEFSMKKGDIFIGCPYQYDNDKTSVGFILRNGKDPGCNQYNSSVRVLTQEETEKVIWGKKKTLI